MTAYLEKVGASMGTTSFSAELHAAAWAALWAARWQQASGLKVPITLVSDSETTADISTGDATSDEEKPLARALRSIALLLHEIGGWQARHVFSHVGHPWNELADTLATAASCGDWSATEPPSGLADFVTEPTAPWAWLPHAPAVVQHAFPPQDEYGFLAHDVVPTLSSDDLAAQQGLFEHSDPETRITDISLATANILSAGPDASGQAGSRATGRLALLAQQFRRNHLDVIGIQESRLRTEARMQIDGYAVLNGSADSRGQGGTQLWVAIDGPLRDDGLQVLYATHRLLVVASAQPACHLVVAHAPCSHGRGVQGLADVKAFWKQASEILRRAAASQVILLGDLNVTLGSRTSANVGPIHGQEETKAGEVVHEWLMEWRVALPATHLEQIGDGATWISVPLHSRRRIDYVGVPLQWAAFARRAYVADKIDLALRRADHLAAVVELSGPLHGESPPRQPRMLGDARRLAEPACRRAFEHALQKLTPTAWSTDADAHAAELEDQIKQCLWEACPRLPGRPRKSWVSGLAARIARCRAALLRASQAGTRSCTTPLITTALQDESRDLALVLAMGPWLERCPKLRYDLAELWQRTAPDWLSVHRMLGCGLKRVLAADREEHICAQAKAVARYFNDGMLPEAYKALRRMRAATPGAKSHRVHVAPCVLDADGRPAQTAGQAADRWLHYFGDMEAAEYLEPSELAAQHLREHARPLHQRHPQMAQQQQGLDTALLPTMDELTATFARARRGRAPGLDQLSNDVLAAAPAALAKLALPLYVKVSLRATEPLAWKGGRLAHAYKGRGPVAECSSSRQLLISSGFGKAWHRLLRTRVVPALTTVQHETVFACRGRGVEMASHLPRAALRWARARKISAGVLFVDVISAYYTVVRGLAIPVAALADTPSQIADRMQLDGQLRARMLELLEQPTATTAAGLGAHAQALLGEAFTNTWFTVPGAAKLARTQQGTRPGDPLADVVFAYVVSRCLNLVRDDLRSEGLVATVSWSGRCSLVPAGEGATVEVTDTLYADDDAFVVFGAADSIGPQITQVAHIVRRRFREFGLAVNFKPGKTEAVVALHGPRARQVKQDFASCGYALELPTEDDAAGAATQLRVVNAYRHMGSLLDGPVAEGPEISARRRACCNERRSLRTFLRHGGASLARKLEVVRSACVSVLLVNASVWGPLGVVSSRSLMAEYEKVIRQATNDHWTSSGHGFNELLRMHRCPPLDVLLREARLRYFGRFVVSAPPVLWALEQTTATAGWRHQLLDDLAWLRTHVHDLRRLPIPTVDSRPWEDLARDAPVRWKSQVREAGRAAAADAWLQWQGEKFDRDLVIEIFMAAPLEARAQFHCTHCSGQFASRGALRSHWAKTHGYRRVARAYADGATCCWCLTAFHERPRLLRHLSTDSVACLTALMGCMEPLDEATIAALDDADRAWKATLRKQGRHEQWAERPAVRLPGPRRRQLTADEIERSALCRAQDGLVFGTAAVAEPAAALSPLTCTAPTWPRCGHGAVWPVLTTPCASWETRVPRTTPQPWLLFLYIGDSRSACPELPWLLETLGAATGRPTMVACLDGRRGDRGSLLLDDNLAYWSQRCRSGVVAGLAAFPPCNTWPRPDASVRGVACARDPRVLWSGPALTEAEANELDHENRTLQAALRLAADLAVSDGSALIALPAAPSGGRAELWRLRGVQHLVRLCAVRTVAVPDGFADARGRGPARYIAVNAPMQPWDQHAHRAAAAHTAAPTQARRALGWRLARALYARPAARCPCLDLADFPKERDLAVNELPHEIAALLPTARPEAAAEAADDPPTDAALRRALHAAEKTSRRRRRRAQQQLREPDLLAAALLQEPDLEPEEPVVAGPKVLELLERPHAVESEAPAELLAWEDELGHGFDLD